MLATTIRLDLLQMMRLQVAQLRAIGTDMAHTETIYSSQPSRSGRHGACQALGSEGLELLKKVARVLALACSLEQRAALERARDTARSHRIGGLVEQVWKLCMDVEAFAIAFPLVNPSLLCHAAL